jgi:hypothetical protein
MSQSLIVDNRFFEKAGDVSNVPNAGSLADHELP